MSAKHSSRRGLILMLGALFAGTFAGFAIGGRGGWFGAALHVAQPLLTGVVCVELLWHARPSARWIAPAFVVLTFVNEIQRSGPDAGQIAIATVGSVTVAFGSLTGRRTLAIVATCLGCCYCALLRWPNASA
jgi:hypothetical protein